MTSLHQALGVPAASLVCPVQTKLEAPRRQECPGGGPAHLCPHSINPRGHAGTHHPIPHPARYPSAQAVLLCVGCPVSAQLHHPLPRRPWTSHPPPLASVPHVTLSSE